MTKIGLEVTCYACAKPWLAVWNTQRNTGNKIARHKEENGTEIYTKMMGYRANSTSLPYDTFINKKY